MIEIKDMDTLNDYVYKMMEVLEIDGDIAPEPERHKNVFGILQNALSDIYGNPEYSNYN